MGQIITGAQPSPAHEGGQSGEKTEPTELAAPTLSLPKGGGAISGMGEKFSTNPVTGTGRMTFPVYSSRGRSGFGPQLSIDYNSANGNGPFGFGWKLGLQSISRKTSLGLPRYDDAHDSDVFLLSGAEDLMPALVLDKGSWTFDVTSRRALYGNQYEVRRYRTRVEGLFARIERWTNVAEASDVFWRSISRENVTTWYGLDAASRIADPADASRIFEWLISTSYDDKGNVIAYEYKAENSAGVDLTQANERNRTRSAQRYLASISYGNRTPYLPDLTSPSAAPLPTDWCFQLIFDYGEYDLDAPVPGQDSQPWTCRADPFSTYRSTFEVRTYRLCRRVLMFHQFPDEQNVGADCLVRSTDFIHATSPPADLSRPFYSYLLSASQSGYTRDGTGGYVSASIPPVQFSYSEALIDETVRDVDPDSLANLPRGLDSKQYRWVDLDGEGLPGILTEQGDAWFYKANLSPASVQHSGDGALTRSAFAPVQAVQHVPATADLVGGKQLLLALSGDGFLSLVQFDAPVPGYFERTPDEDWEPFTAFASMPVVNWNEPNLRFIDLTGDGFADVLISGDNAFWWHNSLSTEGFGPGLRVPQAVDEENGPRLLFADGTESIFLADMSGDGLTDLVRVRVAEVCYWPNLGYGRFGTKVTMDGVPRFDRAELFDSRRIRLADIDGSGTADVIYLAGGEVHLYFSLSGNGLAARRVLANFASVDSASTVEVLDLLGKGTACLVWSSPLAGDACAPMRYIDLMAAGKPHLLTGVANNLGAETHVQYAPSTKFYVLDKMAGTPWITRLPFPVQVVECVETLDFISRNRFVTRYSYHHGYYDGVEREFRGFGRVDQWDTGEIATLGGSSSMPAATNEAAASNVPPVLTKTWFHTGAYFGEAAISAFMQAEYYAEGDPSSGVPGLTGAQFSRLLLDDTVLPADMLLPDGSRLSYTFSPEEFREACRALRGSLLRQEVYALDGSPGADRPYSVSEHNYTIEAFQPRGPNQYGVFFSHPRETIDFRYERQLYWVADGTITGPSAQPTATEVADPRVSHVLTLSVDQYGNVLRSASVAYGRRYLDPALTPADQATQATTLCTDQANEYTNAVDSDDVHRTPLPAQNSTYELIQVAPATQPGVTNLFGFAELQTTLAGLADGLHDLPYEDLAPTGLTPGQAYRRLIGQARIYYRPDDLGAAAGDPRALLPLRALESLALPGAAYHLAFTPGLIMQVYQRDTAALLPTPANVLGSTVADGGGYVDLDRNGYWWIPAVRTFYVPTPPSSPQELSQARQHFFLPRRLEDPFGNAATVSYDPADLLAEQTTDAVGNVASVTNDYRVLTPVLLTDPNGNQAAVTLNVLGLVTATALMGKPGQNLGDTLTGFSPDLTQAQIDAFHDAPDPHTLAAPLLGNATTRIIYNMDAFRDSQAAAPDNPTAWQPSYAATIARETHVSALTVGQQSAMQISFSYSDGFGREIQRKTQAEPGPVTGDGPMVNPRWAGSGWTIFNNKGKPVRQYEPFFSQLPSGGQQFEFGTQVGVSPILCYDPPGRVIATIYPNHTYTKSVFDPWHLAAWDADDTVAQPDPAADPDVGGFFQRLPAADYSLTWYAQRSQGGLGPLEQAAATQAAARANTPAVRYFDPLGRTFLSVADNGTYGKYASHTELDIQGNQRSHSDPLGREVATHDYMVTGGRIRQASMEAGERWTLSDATGKGIRAWDSRGHNFRAAYDALRRPTEFYVLGTDPVSSDPRTLATEVCYETIAYGEGQPDDQTLNLRTRVFQHHDTAGLVANVITDPATAQQMAYDFKGNSLGSSRQFVQEATTLPDWSQAPSALLADVFTVSTQYDALNRVITSTAPDSSVIELTYNEAGLLSALNANLPSATAPTPFVTNIDYNAKGQRVLIEYGNNVSTTYGYDPLTFRLTSLMTTRPGFPPAQRTVQDLSYIYDPADNITHIQEDADIQNVVFFKNRRVPPSADFSYDAIYRLIQATGREQLGLTGSTPLPPAATSYNDVPRIGLIGPGDGNAMGTYTEQYVYDRVGNLRTLIHKGSDPANPGWSRSYTYNEPSQLDSSQVSNRLSSSAVSGSQPLTEPYTYDPHGSMTSMPQLQLMQWDFLDHLSMTRRQAVNASDNPGTLHQGQQTYYVYNAAGERVRKTTVSGSGVMLHECFYLGGYEICRSYGPQDGVTLERHTLHVMDDKQRVALVETVTVNAKVSPVALPATTTRYQFGNYLGSACLELDEVGAVITYEEYYPYGSTSYQAGTTTTETSLKRYRYTGKERDKETGFYYQGARYYAPWLCRWTACDPAGLRDGSDLYRYCRDNPIRLADPGGTQGADAQQMMMGMMWERMGQEASGMIESMIGGHAKVSPRANTVDYSGPEGGVGGAVGGVVRVGTLLAVPIERNPTQASLTGMETAASFIPYVDPIERLATGKTVTMQPTSRAQAALQLGLEVLPFALEVGDTLSVGSRATTTEATSLSKEAELLDATYTGAPDTTRPATANPASVPADPPAPPQPPASPPAPPPPPASNQSSGIVTPHGVAEQSSNPYALTVRQQVQNEATLYRQGIFGVQQTGTAQFWSPQNPLTTADYTKGFGMPTSSPPDWIMGGTLKADTPVVTRPAPALGSNPGGKIEVVTNPGDVGNLWFHMP